MLAPPSLRWVTGPGHVELHEQREQRTGAGQEDELTPLSLGEAGPSRWSGEHSSAPSNTNLNAYLRILNP